MGLSGGIPRQAAGSSDLRWKTAWAQQRHPFLPAEIHQAPFSETISPILRIPLLSEHHPVLVSHCNALNDQAGDIKHVSDQITIWSLIVDRRSPR